MAFFSKNRGERKSAARAQENAYNKMSAALDKAERAREDYRAGSAERMKGVKEIGDKALGRFQAYERGEDVGSIHPMLAKQMGDISKNYEALSRVTSGMGSNALAQNDPRYMQKMQKVGLRDLAKSQGGMIASAAAQARDRDLGEYTNSLGSQIGEERFGLGLNDTGFGQTANQLSGAGQWRSGAMNEGQLRASEWGNMAQGVASMAGAISDERVKSDKKKSKYGLKEVTKLEPITYTIGGKPEVGFSAQQVEKEIPELAGDLGGGLKGVDYPKMTAVHNKAISELKAEIDSLKKKKGNKNV